MNDNESEMSHGITECEKMNEKTVIFTLQNFLSQKEH